MAASAQNHHHHRMPNLHDGGATSAPPPTPSTQSNSILSSTTAAGADTLSHLLHRLPPALSLHVTRRTTTTTATCPPLVSLSCHVDHDSLPSSSYQLGFFQLTNHSIPSQLAHSAESEALSLFDLSSEKKESLFPKNNWPFGHYNGDEDDHCGESFCLDSESDSESLSLPCLSELTRELERVGLRIVELLSGSIGFENPIRSDDPNRRLNAMTWLSEDMPGNKEINSGGFYPYIVGLQYQIRNRKYALLGESSMVSVLPNVDSVLVTIGDIAQVWSNGKLKKVKGRPIACSEDQGMNKFRSISITVLLTLPLISIVSPLVPRFETRVTHEGGLMLINEDEEEDDETSYDVNNNVGDIKPKEKWLFNSFCFEDYAWRVYHERLPLKDPLHRYRIKM